MSLVGGPGASMPSHGPNQIFVTIVSYRPPPPFFYT